ncbi:hypothetical protein Back11_31890 [Paenibacillus baekrokdamisoli]|uniref:Uncharacterized protein n=1 Tax=Paenibacillus baekrokdamisoli TaxID=1712516 RepID=A0A3G9JF95_9BACL|nr:oligosaccharide flippase family protein [Paenibacillus baekrokdamisoli]MBB3071646.1 O-antigen/teichoic acid export membrane protein [Paenibacillus baekrokdamisoli]BBH21844.1 hypothetical protein Back11_31890 [Paenibacillus baekrokdamisoli]
MISRFRDSLLLKNTMWMFAGQGFKILLQAAYFIIIARTLGVNGYGIFVGTVSLVAILAPFSSLGRGELLVMNVSRDPDVFRTYWGNAILMTFISGIILTSITFLAAQYVLPASVHPMLIFWIAISDLILYRILDISGQSYQAMQKLKRTAQIQVTLGVLRLIGAVALILLLPTKTPETWGFLYFMSTLICMLFALTIVIRELGIPKVQFRKLIEELKQGFYFSISLSSVVIYNDINKTMLVRFGDLQSAGIFSAASRIMDVTLTPLRSLMSATYAKFFKEGEQGIGGSLALTRKLLPVAVIYSAMAGIGIYIFAPYLPWILGNDYKLAVEAIRWLAIIPFLKSIQSFAADTLTGAGYQGTRSGIQASVAIMNVIANLIVIPIYLWRGTVVVTIVTEIILAICYWTSIYLLNQRRLSLSTVSE